MLGKRGIGATITVKTIQVLLVKILDLDDR